MKEKHQPAASCTSPTEDVPATQVHALDRNRILGPFSPQADALSTEPNRFRQVRVFQNADTPSSNGSPSPSQANPFRERICRVFSTSPARDSLSFEDFLDLLSVFSDTATPDIKSHYAFRIFDFDDDGTLNREDLSQLVNCLTGEGEDTRLSASEMKQLIDNILEESDIDRDGTINLSEFQHVISRSPDFANSFKIVL